MRRTCCASLRRRSLCEGVGRSARDHSVTCGSLGRPGRPFLPQGVRRFACGGARSLARPASDGTCPHSRQIKAVCTACVTRLPTGAGFVTCVRSAAPALPTSPSSMPEPRGRNARFPPKHSLGAVGTGPSATRGAKGTRPKWPDTLPTQRETLAVPRLARRENRKMRDRRAAVLDGGWGS